MSKASVYETKTENLILPILERLAQAWSGAYSVL